MLDGYTLAPEATLIPLSALFLSISLANACEVQLSYAIGVAEPISALIDTERTAKVSEKKISEMVRELFPLTPSKMIAYLKLARPIYAETSYGGHFGCNLPNFTWEKTDMVDKIRRAAGLKPLSRKYDYQAHCDMLNRPS